MLWNKFLCLKMLANSYCTFKFMCMPFASFKLSEFESIFIPTFCSEEANFIPWLYLVIFYFETRWDDYFAKILIWFYVIFSVYSNIAKIYKNSKFLPDQIWFRNLDCVKHKNPEIVFFRIALQNWLFFACMWVWVCVWCPCACVKS